jgi:hypothetical protein
MIEYEKLTARDWLLVAAATVALAMFLGFAVHWLVGTN